MRYSILFIWLSLSLTLLSQSNWSQVTVVGNAIGTESLTKAQVTSIFKGMKSRWMNDEDVTIVLLSSKHSGCEVMAATIFGRDMKYVKKYWLNLVFQGRANPPVYLDSNEEVLNYVKKHPGAIGVVIDNENVGSLKIKVL